MKVSDQFFGIDNVIHRRFKVKFLIFGKLIFESVVMYKILFNLVMHNEPAQPIIIKKTKFKKI